jgi:hypothetical protein
MDIPKINDNQFAVGKAEYATGFVLTNDGKYFRNGEDISIMYEIFENYNEALNFVITKVKNNPKIECWITDSKGNHILTYDLNGERKIGRL